ncbi:MAG: PTS sugar transporter subunit IIA [Leptotrichiaceae bacterium]|nr:PTS sugar transporter subunit IIA [Leptotrichiaceae bacterium]MBP6281420.1 PTS sugar transporter subunit IIA [Leptotrichiaceae bacterium]MBP7100044.1 PTS sugar transporter subunit IIA [Leptotrichiaceae bacterium]MBP7725391.1 PTS sugar transporter subunit IIA [Leptotrichiaceae bacterium]MBP9628967.1 PTS sugar transporter subunit IIA [Leptotrichiaceae bacterium]
MPNTNIADYIKVEAIELDLKSKNKNSVIKELYENIKKLGLVKDEEGALKDLFAREEMGSTGIGKNVALPHAKTDAVDELIMTVGISREGIEYGGIDEENVNIFFMFLCPMDKTQEYLKTLARISRLIREDKFREKLIKSKTPNEIVEIILTEEK